MTKPEPLADGYYRVQAKNFRGEWSRHIVARWSNGDQGWWFIGWNKAFTDLTTVKVHTRIAMPEDRPLSEHAQWNFVLSEINGMMVSTIGRKDGTREVLERLFDVVSTYMNSLDFGPPKAPTNEAATEPAPAKRDTAANEGTEKFSTPMFEMPPMAALLLKMSEINVISVSRDYLRLHNHSDRTIDLAIKSGFVEVVDTYHPEMLRITGAGRERAATERIASRVRKISQSSIDDIVTTAYWLVQTWGNTTRTEAERRLKLAIDKKTYGD